MVNMPTPPPQHERRRGEQELVEEDAPLAAAPLNLPLPEEAPEDHVDEQEGQGDDHAVGERQAEELREPHPLHEEEREDRIDDRGHGAPPGHWSAASTGLSEKVSPLEAYR